MSSKECIFYFIGCVFHRGDMMAYVLCAKTMETKTEPPTIGGAVTNCCTNCVETMGARFTFLGASRLCGPPGWLALLLTKAGDVETNPRPRTTNKSGLAISAINKYMLGSRYL